MLLRPAAQQLEPLAVVELDVHAFDVLLVQVDEQRVDLDDVPVGRPNDELARGTGRRERNRPTRVL